MVAASSARIAELLGDEALVIDVGGGTYPHPRADWVLDLLPYESRGAAQDADGIRERFSAERWVARDICEREPWPFADDSFDFAICSQTLEDVRDPIWVCSELSRVAKAGYVETPAPIAELAYSVAGPFVGWSHHRWIVEERSGELEFRMKPHFVHAREDLYLTGRQAEMLTDAERVNAVFWTGRIPARERIDTDPAVLEADLARIVARHRAELAARIPPDPPWWRVLAWQIRHRRLRSPHGPWRSSE